MCTTVPKTRAILKLECSHREFGFGGSETELWTGLDLKETKGLVADNLRVSERRHCCSVWAPEGQSERRATHGCLIQV